jgi:ribosomal protein L16/L10AE
MAQNVRRGGKIWVHIFPDKPIIVRPSDLPLFFSSSVVERLAVN